MSKNNLYIEPHPNKVLIQISKKQIDEITDKWITRNDGTKVKLAIRENYSEGYDKRFEQNVSVGVVLAVGMNVKNIYPSDLAVIDYLATNDSDVLVGYQNGNQIICVDAATTYHTKSATPAMNGRRAWVKGDFDVISSILGVVRNNKIIAFDPYVFLVTQSNMIVQVLANGKIIETKEDISRRDVLSARKDSVFKDGDTILIKEENMFSRVINGATISVVFEKDILLKI